MAGRHRKPTRWQRLVACCERRWQARHRTTNPPRELPAPTTTA